MLAAWVWKARLPGFKKKSGGGWGGRSPPPFANAMLAARVWKGLVCVKANLTGL